jgi:hypothetical protein
MKLDVSERIRLLGILPEKGNLLTLKIVSTLRDDLSFSEKEHKALNFKTEGNFTRWSDNVKPKDVKLGDQAKEIVVKALKELDEKEELTLPDVGLWERFIGGEGEGK